MSTDKSKEKTHRLSLKGSSKLVAEFFEYSINTILFQRGVYPAEDFTPVKKYGLNMLVTSDDAVRAYIRKIMSQLNRWMADSKISKLVVVISSKETGEAVERWQFDVQLHGKAFKQKQQKATAAATTTAPPLPGQEENSADAAAAAAASLGSGTAPGVAPPPSDKDKSEKQIHDEIQSIFRQITASVTFLPQLDGDCTFNVLVYADADSDVPIEWGDSDPREIEGGERVQLRSFSTQNHKVDTLVSYKLGD